MESSATGPETVAAGVGEAGSPESPSNLATVDRLQQRMTELQEQSNAYARREEAERHRLRQLNQHLVEAQRQLVKFRRMKAQRGGVNATKMKSEQSAKQIRILEAKLNASRVRASEALAANDEIKADITRRRMEQRQVRQNYGQVTQELQADKAEMARLMEQAAKIAQDTEKLKRQKERLAEEEATRQEMDRDLWRSLDNYLEKLHGADDAAGSRRARGGRARERGGGVEMTSEQEGKILEQVATLDQQARERRRAIVEWERKTRTYEAAFTELREATGISDLEELVNRFIRGEQEIFGAYTYIQRVQAEVEDVDAQTARLAQEMEQLKKGMESSDSQNMRVVRMLEERSAEYLNASEEYAARSEQHASVLNQLCGVVQRLYNTLGGDQVMGRALASAMKEAAGAGGAQGGAPGGAPGGAAAGGAAAGGAAASAAAATTTAAPGSRTSSPRMSRRDSFRRSSFVVDDVVTEANVLLVLGVVEQAAHDVIRDYAGSTSDAPSTAAMPSPPVPPAAATHRTMYVRPPSAPALTPEERLARRRNRRNRTAALGRLGDASVSSVDGALVSASVASPVDKLQTSRTDGAAVAASRALMRRASAESSHSHSAALSPVAMEVRGGVGVHSLDSSGAKPAQFPPSSAFMMGDEGDDEVEDKPLTREEMLQQIQIRHNGLSLPEPWAYQPAPSMDAAARGLKSPFQDANLASSTLSPGMPHPPYSPMVKRPVSDDGPLRRTAHAQAAAAGARGAKSGASGAATARKAGK